MKRSILILLLLCLSCLLFSQNSTSLNKLSRELSDKFHQEKEEALRIAKERNLVIRETTEDGSTIELMSFKRNMPMYYITHNAQGASLIKTSNLYPGGSAGLSLTGSGQSLALWDEAKIFLEHQEFQGRAIQGDNPSYYSSHATHVGGTMIAGGVTAAAKGMSFQANLVGYDWNNDASEMLSAANQGLKVSNHSYGYITGWRFSYSDYEWYWYGDTSVSETEDYYFGYYSENARTWDIITRNAPEYLIVKSAGNDRGDGPAPGTSHYVMQNGNWTQSNTVRELDGGNDGYDCISHASLAKNILTVGAVNNNAQMSSFSGWGPTDDGRIKPDIVAKGVSVYSTEYEHESQTNTYSFKSGTSMSSPMVAGSVGILLQHQQDLHGDIALKAATLKALIIHTANDEIGGTPGPDYRFGWGLMDTEKAIQVMSDNLNDNAHIYEMSIINNQTISMNIIATGEEPIKATIVWADIPATVSEPALNSNELKLVNDLDLRIFDSSENEFMPYILDPANPSLSATTGDNFRDNVEVVFIDNPVPGETYTVSISHKYILHNNQNQDFSLIITGNANNINHPAPSNLIASNAGNNMLLSWNSVNSYNLTGYNLFRSTVQDIDTPESWTEIVMNTTQTYAIDTEWESLGNNAYKYIVHAVYSDGVSANTFSSTVYKSDDGNQFGVYLGNIDSQTQSNQIPFNYNYKNGVSQSIFLEEEIGYSGNISSMSFQFNGYGDIPNDVNVAVYLATTSEQYFQTVNSWIPFSEFTQVFSGSLSVSDEGLYNVMIPFDTVFEYNGGNLVIMTHRLMTENSYNQNNKFNTTVYQNNRTILARSDDTVINLSGLTVGIIGVAAPNTILYFMPVAYGSLEGIISESSQPVNGVRVSIDGSSLSTVTNDSGEYSFDFVPIGEYLVTAYKPGYQTYSSEILNISVNETLNHNFEMQALDNVSVTGTAYIANTDIPVQDAQISLYGYQHYENILTNEQGQFIINNVIANAVYNLQIISDGFNTFNLHNLSVHENDLDLGGLYLVETKNPPSALTAEFVDRNVELNWNAPNSQTNNCLITQSQSFINNERALQGYNVYRNQILLNTTPITDINYSDIHPPEGFYFYSVTAVYDGGESSPISITFQVPGFYQQINLSEGWNLISTNRQLEDADFLDLFESLINNNSLIMVQDVDNHTIQYIDNQWVNEIGNMQSNKGYYVKMNSDNYLSIEENPVQLPMTINLRVGWNLVNYPYSESYPGISLLQTAVQNNIISKVMSQEGMTIELLPNIGIIDDIQLFHPGQGYAFKSNHAITLTFPALSRDLASLELDKAIKQDSGNRTEYYQPVWTGNGWKHFNYFIIANQVLLNQLSIGDEIALFDGEVCVGAISYSVPTNYLRINASLNDGLDGVNGFTEGNPISLRIWKSNTGIEYSSPLINVYSGENIFNWGASTVVSIDNLTSIGDDTASKITTINSIYPNPFNPETNINFYLSKSGFISLEVYNIKGQKVKTLATGHFNSGNHQIVWNGVDNNERAVSSGIYFTKLISEDKQMIKKMVLIK